MNYLLILSFFGFMTNLMGLVSAQIVSINCEGTETTINVSRHSQINHMYLATETDNVSGDVKETYYGRLFNWQQNEQMDLPNAFINGFYGISQTNNANGSRIELKLRVYNNQVKDQAKYSSVATYQKVKVATVTMGLTSIGQSDEVFFNCSIK